MKSIKIPSKRRGHNTHVKSVEGALEERTTFVRITSSGTKLNSWLATVADFPQNAHNNSSCIRWAHAGNYHYINSSLHFISNQSKCLKQRNSILQCCRRVPDVTQQEFWQGCSTAPSVRKASPLPRRLSSTRKTTMGKMANHSNVNFAKWSSVTAGLWQATWGRGVARDRQLREAKFAFGKYPKISSFAKE